MTTLRRRSRTVVMTALCHHSRTAVMTALCRHSRTAVMTALCHHSRTVVMTALCHHSRTVTIPQTHFCTFLISIQDQKIHRTKMGHLTCHPDIGATFHCYIKKCCNALRAAKVRRRLHCDEGMVANARAYCQPRPTFYLIRASACCGIALTCDDVPVQ
jgi:hypothetical protein